MLKWRTHLHNSEQTALWFMRLMALSMKEMMSKMDNSEDFVDAWEHFQDEVDKLVRRQKGFDR